MAIYSITNNETTNTVNEESNMFDYVAKIMKRIIHLRTDHAYPEVKYTYKVPGLSTNINTIYELAKDKEKRIELLNTGKKYI